MRVLVLARLLLPLVPMQSNLGFRAPTGPDYAIAARRSKSVLFAKVW